MKMYEEYDSCRDQSNKYFEPQDNALLPLFLQNFQEESITTDYMREFQGSYPGIDSTAAAKTLIFKTEPDDDREEWKKKDAKDWSSSDVLHWIAHIAAREKFPYELVNATSFNVSGKELLCFSKKDFMIRDEKYGCILYDSLHKSQKYLEDIHMHYQAQNHAKKEVKLQPLMTSSSLSKNRLVPYTSNGLREETPYGLVPVPESYQNDMTHSSESYPFELDPVSEDRDKCGEGYNGERKNSSDTSLSSDTEHSDFEVKKEPKKSVGPAKRPPGRPPGVKSKKEKPEKKTGRLWEFIRDLLLDPQHCPSVICWENHDDGVFRFVKSEKVAKIWGDRKGNEKMNYEKLSRAMRYYYRSKVLQPVIGRRLVYKFGPTARGWKTENPNFRH